MMELFAKRMTWELDNEEGLSCLFFELEDGYFTLSRKTGAEALRLEMNDPANGQLIDPDCFLLDMGWYQDRYIISVIHNFDWANPVQQYETTETNQLPALLMEAVYLVEKESRSAVVN